MANVYDVNFNIYTSIVVSADSREEAEEEFFGLDNAKIIERIVQSIKDGGIDVGTIELVGGDGVEEIDDEDPRYDYFDDEDLIEAEAMKNN